MTKNTILKGGAGLAAAVALAVGGVALSSGADNSSNSATAAQPNGTGTFKGGAPNGRPQAGAPGLGTPVTGAAAAKAKAAALAKYPGTVERVMKAPGGSGYEVHVIKSDGSEVHVLVSASFQVTGTEAGGPPQGLRPQAAPTATGAST